MTKTIRDLAVDYLHNHKTCCNIEDFEAGANAVIEIIGDIIIDKFPNKRETILSLIEKIKELKGEQL